MNRMPVEQISPNKEVDFRDTTAAFTLAPESGASPCRASSPGDWALYAVLFPSAGSGQARLIALHSGFLAQRTRRTSAGAARALAPRARRSLADPPLPSASTYGNV